MRPVATAKLQPLTAGRGPAGVPGACVSPMSSCSMSTRRGADMSVLARRSPTCRVRPTPCDDPVRGRRCRPRMQRAFVGRGGHRQVRNTRSQWNRVAAAMTTRRRRPPGARTRQGLHTPSAPPTRVSCRQRTSAAALGQPPAERSPPTCRHPLILQTKASRRGLLRGYVTAAKCVSEGHDDRSPKLDAGSGPSHDRQKS